MVGLMSTLPLESLSWASKRKRARVCLWPCGGRTPDKNSLISQPCIYLGYGNRAALCAYSSFFAFVSATYDAMYSGTFSTLLVALATGWQKVSTTGTTPVHVLSVTSSLVVSFA